MSESKAARPPKEIAQSFCHFMNTRQIPALFALASPTATWWVQGRPELGTTYVGTQPFSGRQRLVEDLLNDFERFSFTVQGVTAEGEKVVVEAKAEGQEAKGARFQNEVILVFTVKEGKIQALKEWADAKEVEAYFNMRKLAAARIRT